MKKNMVDALLSEAFQSERSAIRHCAIEADRLRDAPPARALLAVSAHATRAEQELRAHAERHGKPQSTLGNAVGALFSTVRDDLADFVLTSERSYRGTLLGMRHGCDVMRLLGMAARFERDDALHAWCTQWMAEREPLVEACAAALVWFAEHPERALANAKTASKQTT